MYQQIRPTDIPLPGKAAALLTQAVSNPLVLSASPQRFLCFFPGSLSFMGKPLCGWFPMAPAVKCSLGIMMYFHRTFKEGLMHQMANEGILWGGEGWGRGKMAHLAFFIVSPREVAGCLVLCFLLCVLLSKMPGLPSGNHLLESLVREGSGHYI